MTENPEREEILPACQEKEGDVNDVTLQSDARDDRSEGGGKTGEPLLETENDPREDRSETPLTPETGTGTSEEVLEVSDPADEAPDPLPREDQRGELLELRAELNALKEKLAESERAHLRAEREYAEFCDLYPEQSLASLPDAVWQDVERGVPLAAAFALSERKRALLRKKAEAQNAQNKKVAPERLSGEEGIFFSPTEVRAMTPAEVRKNYEKIVQSMQKWN